MKLVLFSLLAFTLFVSSTQAQMLPSNDCVPPTAVQRLTQKFKIELEPQPRLCTKGSPTEMLLQTLAFAEALQLRAPFPRPPFNQNLLGVDWLGYIAYLAPHIQASGLDPFESAERTCAGEVVVAYVRAKEQPQQMFLCKLFFSPKSSAVERLSTLLHEAHHHLGYPHVKCKRGPREEVEGGCDESVEEHGSYAVSLESYAKLAFSAPNLHPASRALAAATALNVADTNFNRAVYKRSRALFLTDSRGEVERFDGSSLTPVPQLSSHDGDRAIDSVLAPRDTNELLVFPVGDLSQKAQRVRAYDAATPQLYADQGKFLEVYNVAPPAERAIFRDALLNNEFAVWVNANWIGIRRTERGKLVDYRLNWTTGEAVRVFSAKDLSVDNPNRLYILDAGGELSRIELKGGGQAEVTKIDNPVHGLRMIARLGAEIYALDADGQVLRRNKQKKFVPVGGALEGRRFQRMSREYEYSPELDWTDVMYRNQ